MTKGDAGSEKSVLLDVKGLKKYFLIRRGLLQKTIGYVKARAAAEKPRLPAVF